jgi:hypothetical protein
MNHAYLTAKISDLEDKVGTRKHKLKLAEQSFTFIVQTAYEANLNPDRSRADSAKIRLAEAYLEISQQKYELENLVDKLKSFKKSLADLAV